MSISDLVPGARVRIKKAFRDHDGCTHQPGGVLTVIAHDFFPHDDGHTLKFEGGMTIRLSGNDPRTESVVYDARGEFWEIVP